MINNYFEAESYITYMETFIIDTTKFRYVNVLDKISYINQQPVV